MLKLLEKIIKDEYSRLVICRRGNIFALIYETKIDGKPTFCEVNVKTLEEYFNEKVLGKLLDNIEQKNTVPLNA